MDRELLRIVEERLTAAGDADEQWALLIMAACEGSESLESVLGGQTATKRKVRPARARAVTEPLGAYLKSITVEGFRGVGPSKTLEVNPGPGLTLVIGRNGSGKSSFAEGLEILLTASNWRWAHRSLVWKDGWRNLHHPSPVSISADFAIEGQAGSTRLTRTWADSAELDDSRLTLSLPGKPNGDPGTLGWTSALESYRPFLSYNELGSMFDEGPTKLHDRLSKILGLGDLDYVGQLLRDARLEREKVLNTPKKSLPALLNALEETDDPRAKAAHAALAGRRWNLDAARKTIAAALPDGTGSDGLAILRALASLETPSREEAGQLAGKLRGAATRVETFADIDAKRIGDLADLLQTAVAFHDQHGDGDCPVCGKRAAIDSTWHDKTVAQLTQLHERTSAWQAVQSEGRSAAF